MAVLNAAQIIQLWNEAGGPDIPTVVATGQTLPLNVVMAAIGLAESSGKTDAINPGFGAGGRPTKEFSVGIWQINTLVHKRFTVDQLKEPRNNAAEAVRIFKSEGLRAWGSYTDRRYLKFLEAAKTAAGANLLPPGFPSNSNESLIIGGLALILLLRD